MIVDRMQALSRLIETTVCLSAGQPIHRDAAVQLACSTLLQTRDQGGIVYVIGNGGSAGIASHFSTDLIKTLEIPASTLFDSNLITCISNDYGYESVFSYPLKILLNENDLLVAISSSGQSQNILQSVSMARNKGTFVLTLSGFLSDNPLRQMGDLNFYLPSKEYGMVETGHFFILHTMIDHLQKG